MGTYTTFHTLFVERQTPNALPWPYGDRKLLFARYLFCNLSYSVMNLIQKDNRIKAETRC